MAKRTKLRNVFKFASKAVDKATVSALNRAATSARAEGVRVIREHYDVKAKDVKEDIRLIKANKNNKVAFLRAVYRGMSLMKFRPKMTKRPRKYKTGKVGGTKVTVKKGARELRKHAFIQKMRSGHVGVFIKTGEKNGQGKEKIKELFGPSAAHMLRDRRVSDAIEKKFIQQYEKEFNSKLDYFIEKF